MKAQILLFILLAPTMLIAEVQTVLPGQSTNTSHSRLQWNLKTFVGEYDRVGRRNDKWDKDARAALEAYARGRVGSTADVATVEARFTNALIRARSAGCDDPMVLFLSSRYVPDPAAKGSSAEKTRAAVTPLFASEYHPVCKSPAYRWAWERFRRIADSNTNVVSELHSYRDQLFSNVVEAAKDAHLPADEIYELCEQTTELLAGSSRLWEGWWLPIEPLLLKHWPNDYHFHLLKGQAYYRYAWQARGQGPASSVGKTNFQRFEERLDISEEALRRAWSMNSQDWRIPTQMLHTMLGNYHSRDDVETWFERAMELNSTNYDACRAKLWWLQPQWSGSIKEMLEFGRECLGSEWKGRVPLIIVQVHELLANRRTGDDRRQYWKQNSDIWADIHDAFEKYFSFPDADVAHRHNYVRLAHYCEQWTVAQQQLLKMSWTNYTYFGGKEAFDRMVGEIKENVSK